MKIEAIRIQGYRSLADLEFRPHEFTVLVGPNNAGKTNVIDALDFLADVYGSGIKLAIDRKGGFENIAFREHGVSQRTISFELVASGTMDEIWGKPPTFPQPDPREYGASAESTRLQFLHRFKLRGHGRPLMASYEIADEEVEVSRVIEVPSQLLYAKRENGAFAADVDSSSLRWLGIAYLPQDIEVGAFFSRLMRTAEPFRELFVSRLQALSLVVAEFVEHLGKMRTFQLVPPVCRLPAAPTPVAYLGLHGENLPALGYHLKDQPGDSWAKVMENMMLILPDLEDIDVQPTSERFWRLDFEEAGVGNSGNRWTSEEVSDGTIRALALFTSLYDPRSSLLAIEEPENSIHPWVLRVLVSACRRVSQRPELKQVVLTTHSPVLIDQLHPAEVAVVWKDRGRTMLAPLVELEPELEASWIEGTFRLSSLLDSGLVRQTVPTP